MLKKIVAIAFAGAFVFMAGCNDGSGNSGFIPLDFGTNDGPELSGGGTGSAPAVGSATELITVAQGGKVSLGDEISLSFPPGSVKEDTRISIERLDSSPDGAADGFSKAGMAYRFSPPGAEFNLDKPAILTMKIDSAALAAKGLDSRTMQIYYFDEEQERYVNVAGRVDADRGVMTARIEHFTIYLPLAMSMVPGNNLPVAALQNPIPNTVRANAPIYFRATARDFDLSGSVAGVRLCRRNLQPAPGAYVCNTMTKETRDNALDTYAYLAPANTLTPADLGPGPDIEYYVEVTDNLGAVRNSGTNTRDVTRIYNAGSINIQPALQDMTSGSIRVFTVRGTDNLGGNFNFIPESSSVLNGAGNILRTEANGITFQATTSIIGGVRANSGGDSISNTVNVFFGQLDRIEVLDSNSQPIIGTYTVREGHLVQFDTRGYDAFGNVIPIIPTWSNASGTIGSPITQNGLLYTLDGTGFGSIQLNLGSVSVTQHIHVQDRGMQIPNILFNGQIDSLNMAAGNGTVYIVGRRAANPGPETRVYTWNGSGWTVGDPFLWSHSEQDIAAAGGQVYVATTRPGTPNTANVYVSSGPTFVPLGGALNVDGAFNAGAPSIAADGTNLYIAFQQLKAGGQVHVHVRRWTGTTWALVGGALNQDTNNTAYGANLKLHGGLPYVSFTEFVGGVETLIVKRWDGSNWITMGAPLNTVATNPVPYSGHEIAVDGTGTPWVAFIEHNGTRNDLHLKRWDGTNWVSIGGVLNTNPTDTAGPPAIAFHSTPFGEVPYMLWQERTNPTATTGIAVMRHWNGTSWVEDSRTPAVFNAGVTAMFRNGLNFLGDTPFGVFNSWNTSTNAFEAYPLRLD